MKPQQAGIATVLIVGVYVLHAITFRSSDFSNSVESSPIENNSKNNNFWRWNYLSSLDHEGMQRLWYYIKNMTSSTGGKSFTDNNTDKNLTISDKENPMNTSIKYDSGRYIRNDTSQENSSRNEHIINYKNQLEIARNRSKDGSKSIRILIPKNHSVEIPHFWTFLGHLWAKKRNSTARLIDVMNLGNMTDNFSQTGQNGAGQNNKSSAKLLNTTTITRNTSEISNTITVNEDTTKRNILMNMTLSTDNSTSDFNIERFQNDTRNSSFDAPKKSFEKVETPKYSQTYPLTTLDYESLTTYKYLKLYTSTPSTPDLRKVKTARQNVSRNHQQINISENPLYHSMIFNYLSLVNHEEAKRLWELIKNTTLPNVTSIMNSTSLRQESVTVLDDSMNLKSAQNSFGSQIFNDMENDYEVVMNPTINGPETVRSMDLTESLKTQMDYIINSTESQKIPINVKNSSNDESVNHGIMKNTTASPAFIGMEFLNATNISEIRHSNESRNSNNHENRNLKQNHPGKTQSLRSGKSTVNVISSFSHLIILLLYTSEFF